MAVCSESRCREIEITGLSLKHVCSVCNVCTLYIRYRSKRGNCDIDTPVFLLPTMQCLSQILPRVLHCIRIQFIIPRYYFFTLFIFFISCICSVFDLKKKRKFFFDSWFNDLIFFVLDQSFHKSPSCPLNYFHLFHAISKRIILHG